MLRSTLLFLSIVALALSSFGQSNWPVVIETDGALITVYRPQPESYKEGRFTARSAVSVQQSTDKDPVFGAFWAEGFLEVDRTTRMGELVRFDVTDARFPTTSDTTRISELKALLTRELPKRAHPVSIDLLVAALEQEAPTGGQYNSDPPEILYRDHAAQLVFIDGDPIYEAMEGSPYERVVNSPLVLVKAKGGTHYLYLSPLWFSAKEAKGPYKADGSAPIDLRQAGSKVDSAMTSEGGLPDPTPEGTEVIVRTKPAELIQTTGAADLKPVKGTALLSATNTENQLFMDTGTQEFYVLLSGRWFASKSLANGPWRFVKGAELPGDFAMIPEGIAEDGVLSSVPGTRAATEATRDAQVPQTATVDRHKVTLEVSYEGKPEWRKVDGTNMSYAINASTTVLKVGERYSVCDNGVWYDSASPNGPWDVSTAAPEAVKDIEPSSPVYNVKYVEVYDHTPDVVYVGYTPGYTGCYVSSGVVVYGTGFYYPPPPPIYYRPRPVTWGFNMHYDPWSGWSMGLSFSVGWFHFGTYGGWGNCYHCGGWWGPPVYRPPYHYRPPYGYYGNRPGYRPRPAGGVRGSGNTINIDNSTNINVNRPGGGIYGDRPGVKPSGKPDRGKASSRPATMDRGRQPKQDVFTDPKGNVFRSDGRTTQQRNAGGWDKLPAAPSKPTTRPAPTSPQRIQQDRARGQQRTNSFQQRPSMGGGGMRQPMQRPAGGGARPMGRGR